MSPISALKNGVPAVVVLLCSACGQVQPSWEAITQKAMPLVTSTQTPEFIAHLLLADAIRNADEGALEDSSIDAGHFEPTQFAAVLHDNLARRHISWRHPICATQIAYGAFQQDDHQDMSPYHFDNCTFSEGLDYIQDRINTTDSYVRKSDWWNAMRALGQALHGIQDFYSHSNYVETMATSYVIIPLWTDAGKLQISDLVSKGLISGTYWGNPKRCPAWVPDHDHVAKDWESIQFPRSLEMTRWGMDGYQAAYNLADRASYEFINYAFNRWPFLNSECGPVR